jgi:hypothetical protein
MYRSFTLILLLCALSWATLAQGFNAQRFQQFVTMRVGTGTPVYWYCVGELYSYPDGKLLAKVEGLDTARLVKAESKADSALQLSRKIFIYRDAKTNAVLQTVNGQPVQHIEYPYQKIEYQLKGEQVVTFVEQGAGLRKQRIGPVEGMSARQFGPTTMFSAPLFLNFTTPRGKYESYENYDFLLVPNSKAVVSPYQLTWNRFGDLPPFFGPGKGIMQLVSYRTDSYAALPATMRDYLEKSAPLWKQPPQDLNEIQALQKAPAQASIQAGPTVQVAQAAPAMTEKIDADVNAKIRQEGMSNSQIMRTLHFFTDVYGPRLTGSPNHENAAKWAVKQMTDWGFANAHLEPWDFGRPGWLNERFSAHMIAPIKDHLTCEVLAWTPGTNGTVTAQAVQLTLPEGRPTQEELTAYFNSIKDKVKGKIVLMGRPTTVPVTINPSPKRMDDKVAKERFSGENPNAAPFGNRPGQGPPQGQPDPTKLTMIQVMEQVDKFLLDSGVPVRINDGGRDHGQIRAFNHRAFDLTKTVPTVVMRNEDYGRIWRILNDGTRVELEFNIVNRSYPEGKTSYNTIAEIPGTDKADEVIMLGGHLDSWHAATGATDNAIGCATMMEAARIIKALGLKPRRTIRVALWSGEEQGLLGSIAYVKEHFGSAENPKPEFAKFGGYFNIDSGTGRARGMSVFGPPEAGQILRQILAPFEDLGVMGALAGRSRSTGGSDHTSFNAAGLPGIGVMQDPIEYGTDTWHTNLDNYERIIEDDAKKSAIAIASAVYHLAMRDELLPRFTKETMPPLPPPPPPRPF